jgi:hypothetical protein
MGKLLMRFNDFALAVAPGEREVDPNEQKIRTEPPVG